MNDRLSREQSVYRLVDHQLNESQRAALLREAEGQPELWRMISLAFVEDQIWRSTIPAAVLSEGRTDSTRKQTDSKRVAPASSVQPWWLALAAVTLIAATITVRMASTIGDRPQSFPGTASAKLTTPDGPYMLEMGDDVQVPLYDQPDSMKDFLRNSRGELSPELLEKLQIAGLDVRPNVRYITGNVPDGRSFVVPVQQYQVSPRFQ